MTEMLAILDTDVAVLILDSRKSPDPKTYARRERALAAVQDLKKRGARCIVTSPTIVELCAWSGGPKEAAAKLRAFIENLRVSSLTMRGAEASGAMLLQKLKPRAPGKSN